MYRLYFCLFRLADNKLDALLLVDELDILPIVILDTLAALVVAV